MNADWLRGRKQARMLVALLTLALALPEGCSKAHSPRDAAPEAAQAPVRPRTQKDYEQLREAWFTRHTVRAAQRPEGQEVPLDPNITSFLKHACTSAGQNQAALEQEGRKLFDAGYDHPIFLRAYGGVLAAGKKWPEAANVNRQALKALEGTVYTKTNTYLAASQLAEALRAQGDTGKTEAAAAQGRALTTLASMISVGEFTTDESQVAFHLLEATIAHAGAPAPWNDVSTNLREKNLDPWLIQMLQGVAEIETAWNLRAEKVSKEAAQRNVNLHLALARTALTVAWKLHPERPEAPAAMIKVAAAEEKLPAGESVKTWFDRAVAAQSDYSPAFAALDEAAKAKPGSVAATMVAARQAQATPAPLVKTPAAAPPPATPATTPTPTPDPNAPPAVPLGDKAPAPTPPATPAPSPTAATTAATQENPAGNNAGSTLYQDQGAAAANDLIQAFRKKDSTLIKTLIQKGTDISAADEKGFTPLHLAAAYRNTEAIQLLLDRNAKIDVKTAAGYTPLHIACDSGALDVVKVLLENGADVNLLTPDGWSPLNRAVWKNYPEVVKSLLDLGAKPNLANRQNVTPLFIAVVNGRTEIAKMLLDLGADPNKSPDASSTPLHKAIQYQHPDIAALLVDLGANVNAPDATGRLPLHLAIETGQSTAAKKLLDTGALPDTPNAQRKTALEIAIEKGDAAMVELLLSHRASARAAASDGTPLLDFARKKGDARIIGLIEAKAARGANRPATAPPVAPGALAVTPAPAAKPAPPAPTPVVTVPFPEAPATTPAPTAKPDSGVPAVPDVPAVPMK